MGPAVQLHNKCFGLLLLKLVMRRNEKKCAIIQSFVITCIIILNGTHSFEFHSDVTCFHLEELPLEFLVMCVSKQ